MHARIALLCEVPRAKRCLNAAVLMVIWFGCALQSVCIGQAQNPGPGASQESGGSQASSGNLSVPLQLLSINTTSLLTHFQSLCDDPARIVAVQEHSMSLAKLQIYGKMARAKQRTLIYSPPVPGLEKPAGGAALAQKG